MNPLTFALISSGLTLADNLLGYFLRKKEKNDLSKALDAAKINEIKRNELINQFNRAFNTEAMDLSNLSAIGINKPLNPETLKGLTAGKILSAKAQGLAKLESDIFAHNRELDMAKLGLPSAGKPIDIGNVILTGLMSYVLGDELFKGNNQNSVKSNTVGNTSTTDINIGSSFVPAIKQNLVEMPITSPKIYSPFDIRFKPKGIAELMRLLNNGNFDFLFNLGYK